MARRRGRGGEGRGGLGCGGGMPGIATRYRSSGSLYNRFPYFSAPTLFLSCARMLSFFPSFKYLRVCRCASSAGYSEEPHSLATSEKSQPETPRAL